MTEHTKLTQACQNRILYSAKFPWVFKTILLNYFNDNLNSFHTLIARVSMNNIPGLSYRIHQL